MIIGCIYHLPDSNIDDFNDALSVKLDHIGKEGKLCLIQGDFNINPKKTDLHAPTSAFINMLYSSYFYPTITKPTRLTRNIATLIDNIITNSLEHISKSGVLFCDISNPLPVFYPASKHTDAMYREDSTPNRFVGLIKSILVGLKG